ncbi:phage tail sheath protein FI [Inquilinus ginsengisoli]|uniref:phage tail sheath family protein n=1 Tax=Inquilinus ginsengisoli TaxID=363840 RepID=UPI003D1D5968
MATAVSYPGVYIEEVPSAVRAIAGVPTSVAAFVGYTARGPTSEPIQIFSYADFERRFGGLDSDSALSYAVSHFFLNGGATGWIVRVAAGAAPAAVDLETAADGAGDVVLTATAQSAGLWGNNIRLVVDYDAANPNSLFNLTIAEVAERNGRMTTVRSESHRNLSMNSFAPNYVASVVNSSSNLVTLVRPGGLAFPDAATSLSGVLAQADIDRLGDNARRLAVSIDGGRVQEFDIFGEGEGLAPGNFQVQMDDLAARIQARVRALDPGDDAYVDFTCDANVNGAEAVLEATSGTPAADREESSVAFTTASRASATGILCLGVVNGGREVNGSAALRPAQSGTAWVRQDPPLDFADLISPASMDVDILDSAGTVVANEVLALWPDDPSRPTNLDQLATQLQAAFSGSARPELAGARLSLVGDRVVVTPAGSDPSVRLRFNSGPTFGAGPDDLTDNAEPNIAAYQLGVGPVVGAQINPVPGADGAPPGVVDLQGNQAAKTGLYALEDVDLFNILLLPGQSDAGLWAAALTYAEQRRAFAIIDLPAATDTLDEARAWLNANGALRHRNAAAYFPRVRMADSLENNRVRSFPNSGAMAGLYARTDATRGVWKAPAGTEASVRGAQGLDYVLTDAENGVLNPMGLNSLRAFPAFGPISWGARTLVGSDAMASEWKYVPVRRLALFLEESLYRGTQWVVFEPNDEPLWAQIRLNVGSFMHNLFRQGAFQGKTPREAYLVQCDSSTTTQDDINLGIVNIVVGFAPLKPAEFVIIKLQQLAGQAGAGA